MAGGQVRPPRRVDVVVADPFLDRVTVVAVRAVTADDDEHRRLVSDLVEQCESLVLVTDGRCPYQPAELDLLRAACDQGKGVFLAVTHADENAAWPAVVRANQHTLARGFPDLVLRPWHPVVRSTGNLPELRHGVLAWARAQRQPVARRADPIRIALDAFDSGWRELLRNEVDAARQSAGECAAAELARLRERLTLVGFGVTDLERTLRSLSATLAWQTHGAVDQLISRVLGRVLAEAPDASVLSRVAVALQRDVAERCCGHATCFRSLRVTGTAVAAIATSREGVSVTDGHATTAVLPPLGIGLTPNCLPMLRALAVDEDADRAAVRVRAWMDRAVRAVEVELGLELSRQFTYLGQAAADLIGDGLDHDLLLV